MKRSLTLTALIMNIVILSIRFMFTLTMGFTTVTIEQTTGSSVGSQISSGPSGIEIAYNTLSIFMMILIVCSIVITGIAFSVWRKVPAEFAKKKGLLISLAVFDYVLFATTLTLSILGGYVHTMDISMNIMCSEFVLVGAILLTIDICLEKRRAIKYQNQVAKDQEDNQTKEEEIKMAQINMEEKIKKLFEMKEKGLISEEEFKELKTNCIKSNLEQKPSVVAVKKKTEMELKFEKYEDMKNRGLISEEECKKLREDYIRKHI